jgi:hypothetical protein
MIQASSLIPIRLIAPRQTLQSALESHYRFIDVRIGHGGAKVEPCSTGHQDALLLQKYRQPSRGAEIFRQ